MCIRDRLTGGWNPTAKHIPCGRNTLADGIWRWPQLALFAADKVNDLTKSMNGAKKISGGGMRVFAVEYLRRKNILTKPDSISWNLMMHSAEPD